MPNALTLSAPIGQGFTIPTSNSGFISVIVDVGGAGGVTSVFGRTGAVVAQSGDYSAGQVSATGSLGATVQAQLTELAFKTPAAVAGGATPALDFNTNPYQVLTLSVNAAPTMTLPKGYIAYLEVVQPGGGTFTVTAWPANVDWSGGLAPTLSTVAGQRDLIQFVSNGTRLRGSVLLSGF